MQLASICSCIRSFSTIRYWQTGGLVRIRHVYCLRVCPDLFDGFRIRACWALSWLDMLVHGQLFRTTTTVVCAKRQVVGPMFSSAWESSTHEASKKQTNKGVVNCITPCSPNGYTSGGDSCTTGACDQKDIRHSATFGSAWYMKHRRHWKYGVNYVCEIKITVASHSCIASSRRIQQSDTIDQSVLWPFITNTLPHWLHRWCWASTRTFSVQHSLLIKLALATEPTKLDCCFRNSGLFPTTVNTQVLDRAVVRAFCHTLESVFHFKLSCSKRSGQHNITSYSVEMGMSYVCLIPTALLLLLDGELSHQGVSFPTICKLRWSHHTH